MIDALLLSLGSSLKCDDILNISLKVNQGRLIDALDDLHEDNQPIGWKEACENDTIYQFIDQLEAENKLLDLGVDINYYIDISSKAPRFDVVANAMKALQNHIYNYRLNIKY